MAAKTVVVLELSGEQAEELWARSGGVDLGQLLRDALGEFIGVRGGEILKGEREDMERVLVWYVAERYSHLGERQQRLKAREVCKRKAMAALLRGAGVVVERSDEG